MFTKRNLLENLSLENYTIDRTKLYNILRQNDNLCTLQCFDNLENLWNLPLNVNIDGSILKHINTLLINDYEKRLVFIDLSQQCIIKEKKGVFTPTRIIGNHYLFYEPHENTFTPSLYDIATVTKIWQFTKPAYFWLSKNLEELIGYTRRKSTTSIDFTHFTKFNYLDGKEEWSFDLASFPTYTDIFGKELQTEVEKFIGIANGVLWVGLTNHTIVLIELETGKQIEILPPPMQTVNNFPYFLSSKSMYIDEENGVLLGGASFHLWEINMSNYQLQQWDLEKYFTKEKVIISSGYGDEIVFDKEYIYFLDKENTKVVVLRRSDKQIVWQYQFVSGTKCRLMPMKLQVQDKRLYVIDDQKTLHVFERK